MTAIIILNWNGADDTLACLHSLEHAQGEFFIVLADNGSTDGSLAGIREYAADSALDIKILELGNNYGFAKGNNKAIAYASGFNPDSYMLLNNDTEVAPDFLTRLVEFLKSHSEYHILTPRINYFYDKNIIWNCGGKQFWGFRKYYFAGKEMKLAMEKEYFPISFVTGCALFFTLDVLDEKGVLLTERFFFGEEDFEFCLRMNKAGKRMACVTDSCVYHKVGASTEGKNTPGRIYLYYLNRYVDVRLNFSALSNMMWRLVNRIVILRYFRKHFGSYSQAFSKLKRLERESRNRETVTQDDFYRLIVKGDYFDETVD